MAKSPENVQKFLEDLAIRLMPKAKMELSILTEMKKKHLRSEEIENESDLLFHWDFPFYHQRLLHQSHDIDNEEGIYYLGLVLHFSSHQLDRYNHTDRYCYEVSEYFPTTTVIPAMLKVFQQLFGLDIQEFQESERDFLSQTGRGSDCGWHVDVRIYSVWSGDRLKGKFLGYLYVDLYPREGKYTHNANFTIYPVSI